MEQMLIVDTDKCTGCRICELVCSMTKQGEFNPRKSYIRVLRNKEMDFYMVALGVKCDFCGDCVEWCMPEAIKFVGREQAAVAWKGTRAGSLPAPLLTNL